MSYETKRHNVCMRRNLSMSYDVIQIQFMQADLTHTQFLLMNCFYSYTVFTYTYRLLPKRKKRCLNFLTVHDAVPRGREGLRKTFPNA